MNALGRRAVAGKGALRIAMIGQKAIPARYGGVETHVEHIATRLALRGHDVWAFCRPRFRPARGEALPEGYTIQRGIHRFGGVRLAYRGSVNTKHLDAASHTLLCAAESALAHRFDIVHFHGIGPAAFAGLPRSTGRKVVSTFHALDWRQVKWGKRATRALKRGEAWGARGSHGVIAVSRIIQAYVQERYGIEARHIPNGAAPQPPRPPGVIARWGLEPGRYVLTVGRIIRDRGLHDLIRAHRDAGRPERLVIVGSETPRTAYSDELAALADDRVVFTGDVFGEDLQDLYAHCRLYALASRVEGLPITVCEAMAHGRALVLSDIRENVEAAGDAAWYFEAGNPDNLRDTLSTLLEDEMACEKLGRTGRTRVAETYNWDTIAEQVEAFYRELLA